MNYDVDAEVVDLVRELQQAGHLESNTDSGEETFAGLVDFCRTLDVGDAREGRTRSEAECEWASAVMENVAAERPATESRAPLELALHHEFVIASMTGDIENKLRCYREMAFISALGDDGEEGDVLQEEYLLGGRVWDGAHLRARLMSR